MEAPLLKSDNLPQLLGHEDLLHCVALLGRSRPLEYPFVKNLVFLVVLLRQNFFDSLIVFTYFALSVDARSRLLVLSVGQVRVPPDH